jgi:hypothetical protein
MAVENRLAGIFPLSWGSGILVLNGEMASYFTASILNLRVIMFSRNARKTLNFVKVNKWSRHGSAA